MAKWHLEELENEMNRIGWRIKSRPKGDDYKISASWIIERGEDLQIDFEGLDDLKTLPIEKSYACSIKNTEINLYFNKKGTNRQNALKAFISKLNTLN